MGAYIWEKSIFGAFEHFETFLISNGPMDHAEFSQHIKNLTSQKELVTMAIRSITVLDKIMPID